MGTCCSTIFSCCLSKKSKNHSNNIIDALLSASKDNFKPELYYYLFTIRDKMEEEEFCFNDDWLRNEEKELIKYTKTSIMKLINDEYVSNDGYEELYNQDNMVLSIKKSGSLLNNQCNLIRMSLTVPLNQYPPNMTLENFWYYISVPEKRLKWDKGLKEYRILEGTEEKGIVYKWMNKPIIIISERDSVEKMIRFKCPKGDLYTFLSSVNDEFKPSIQEIVRITDWMSGYRFSENNNNLYIQYLSQIDFKMATPSTILKYTMPNKLKEWYTLMRNKINEDYQSSNNGNEDL